jgi:hypothetical protein
MEILKSTNIATILRTVFGNPNPPVIKAFRAQNNYLKLSVGV